MHAKDISHIVNANIVQPDFAKALRQPGPARRLPKRRRRNPRHLHLPLRQLRFLRAQPVKRRPHLGRSRQSRHIRLHRRRNVRHIRTWGRGAHQGYCVILHRTEKKGDYLRREPQLAIDMDEIGGWVEERWTLVTFKIKPSKKPLSFRHVSEASKEESAVRR